MVEARAVERLSVSPRSEPAQNKVICGVLPIVHLKRAISGSCLVSVPFVDGGGILADSAEAERLLLAEAVTLGQKLGVRRIELRHERPLEFWNEASPLALGTLNVYRELQISTSTNKARMLLRLPADSGMLMKSFKSKLRSQINKALREGFVSREGGPELLDDFYRVFLVNMRDLGSPVHSLDLMRNSMAAFPDDSRIFVVYSSKEPVAAALVFGFGRTLRNPWASSLRKYASQGPNMVLYLRMLEYACKRGFEQFDFGRSTPGDGTFKFKEQWGAEPASLYWHSLGLDGRAPVPEGVFRGKYGIAARYWRRLPLLVTRVLGPSIRKHISL